MVKVISMVMIFLPGRSSCFSAKPAIVVTIRLKNVPITVLAIVTT